MAKPKALPGLHIEDIAPTILYMMDLPVPSDMDGRVLTEMVATDILASRPVKRGKPIGLWPNEDEAVFSDEVTSEQDDAAIRERLRALGYLG